MYLIDPNVPQFKGNLHTHSTLSDGKLTPTELKAAYQARGYDFLCITDHELCIEHSYLNDEHFLMLTGYEMGGINSEKWNRRAKTYHLCFISREPHNSKQVWRDKGLREDQLAMLADPEAEYCCCRDYSVENINNMIALAKEQGYLAIYNHPMWSLQTPEDFLGLKGLWGMEIYNTTCCMGGYDDYNFQVLDMMLRSGMHLVPVAADDLHNLKHPRMITGFTVVSAPKLEYGAVIRAMEKGDAYASTGPRIRSLSFEDGTVTICCDEAVRVTLSTQYRFAKCVKAPMGSTITEAKFDISPWLEDCTEEEAAADSPYFRLSVFGPDGERAYTRPYRRSEIL